MNKRWRIAGVNFDHFHMGDLLRMVHEHPNAEIVAICDGSPQRMQAAVQQFGLPADRVFTDPEACLEATRPDVVILCPATADHATWCERVAPFDVHVLMEKPFAASLDDADRMIRAMAVTQKQLAINWPLRWYPTHATAYRLVLSGRLGEIREVHYYDGNRGPLWHGADKVEREPSTEEKASSWFYRKSAGGGSLFDYLGYGTTLATWYHQGRKPLEVCCMLHQPAGLEVDEHSVTLAHYDTGLSKFETRWGTFTDPWTHQPQPKCGFIICGSEGTLSSFDFEPTVRLQTRDCPAGQDIAVDRLPYTHSNPVAYFLDRLEHELPVEGPLSPAMSRAGQQIVDTAVRSAQQRRTLPLLE